MRGMYILFLLSICNSYYLHSVAHVLKRGFVADALNATNRAKRVDGGGDLKGVLDENFKNIVILAKSALHRFYSKHSPKKIDKISAAFAHYGKKGKEERLFTDLEKKYNVRMQFAESDILMDVTSKLQIATVECTTGKLKYAGCNVHTTSVEDMRLPVIAAIKEKIETADADDKVVDEL